MINHTYYRALQTRDQRFDGRFFTAVRTTKIFCRPVCPAPTPKFENCQFFSSAAAALAAGFRPCLRCRPELSPDLTPYLTTASSVNRALRLIGEGLLDDGTVETLANRLGMGSRHLRRLFNQHLGVTPIAVAQTRRILFAKQLIDETALPMTDIAMAAGFGSIRRFNTAIQTTYQKAPRQLRKLQLSPASPQTPPPQPATQPEIQIKLPFDPPYAWDALVRFLQPRVTAGIELITPDCYRRSIGLAGQQGTVAVRPQPNAPYLLAQIQFPEVAALSQIVERLRQLFDLRANVSLIASQLEADPDLRPLVHSLPGLRVPGCWDAFELAVRAILGQQVTVAAATRMAGRLVQTYGDPLQVEAAELAYVFPPPARLAEADLTQIGVTSQRAKAISVLAAQVAADPDFLTRADLDETQLCALPGIGAWTASYIAMRALREPDAFPASDLGLLRAMAKLGQPVTKAALLHRSQAWRPWRAYAAMYLWQIDHSSYKTTG